MPYAQPGLKAVLRDALQWDSFQDFLALGIPGGFMMQLEGNSYDITTLLAGLLGTLFPNLHSKSSHDTVCLSIICVISGDVGTSSLKLLHRLRKLGSKAKSLSAVQARPRWMRTMCCSSYVRVFLRGAPIWHCHCRHHPRGKHAGRRTARDCQAIRCTSLNYATYLPVVHHRC